jgi:GH43 family beta-xylosidase
MLATREGSALAEYLNPVYSKSFPDPFVLKLGGDYYAYCTGFAPDGRVFGVLHSRDLVTWTEVGGAMEPLENSPPYYWAPEVTFDNGKFCLYYSVGNEVLMELRVAVSDRPDRGFVDSGRRLTKEDFAIDAHVFIDDDGTRYLFYATDFLAHTHIGTGTVVDRMIDRFTLEGDPRPVTRAKYNWQVYDPNRKEKGGVRWHTVEGPTVLKRKGLYYEMFSGGNWQNTTYGVSFAVTDDVARGEEWLQYSDGENVLPILRTLPDRVIGPGHNSVVRGPNNRELYCVYHRWSGDERVMAIDRMDFAGDRIFVVGASDTPQPAPFEPTIKEGFQGTDKPKDLVTTGPWTFAGDGAVSAGEARSEMRLRHAPESFLCEFVWALAEPLNPAGEFGIVFERSSGPAKFTIHPHNNAATWTIQGGDRFETFQLPSDFDLTAEHVIRIESDHRSVRIHLDSRTILNRTQLDERVAEFIIFTDRQPLRIREFELTEGFEELFETNTALENGWEIDGEGIRNIANGELVLEPERKCMLRNGPALTRLELAANFRNAGSSASGEFGLVLDDNSGEAFRLGIDCENRSVIAAGETSERSPLPEDLELGQYHQLRIIKAGGSALCYVDDVCIGDFPVTPAETRTAVYASGTAVGIEMVRLTRI